MRAILGAAVVLAIGGGALAACTQSPALVSPRALNRPARVAFVCFNGANEPVALEECRNADADGTPADGFTLVALMPQQTRGEVAAVDVTSSPPRVLDSDRRVPGFTFVPVGEVPSAIAVSPTNPRCTWVANRGSRGITGVETVRFREESLASGTVQPERSLFDEGPGPEVDGGPLPDGGTPDAGMPGDGGLDVDGGGQADAGPVDAGADAGPRGFQGRPHAMELIGGALYVTLPEDGRIARVSVDPNSCEVGTIEWIVVPAAIPFPPAGPIDDPAIVEPLASQDAATLALCPEASTLPMIAPVATEAPALDSPPAAAPMPYEIEVEMDADGITPTALLIGDLARPVIHRFDLAANDFVGSFRTPGPVRDLAITPFVEDVVGGPRVSRYVYAIDDRDGSVFVLDHSTGHVLPVNATSAARSDRLAFRSTARTIEAFDTGPIDQLLPIAPDSFRPDGPAGPVDCAAPTIEPMLLHGVFVAVGLADGSVRIVDVLDRDARCRDQVGDDLACQSRFGIGEALSYVRRHRPRIGTRLATGVALVDPPSVSIEGTSTTYGDDGQLPTDGTAPEFAMSTCRPGLGQVFPAEGETRICAITDPWAAEPETWTLTWQGAIPGTTTTRGNITTIDGVDDAFTITSGIDLCAAGVLPGDFLAITSPLPAATAEDEGCRTLVGLDLDDTQRPVLLRIASVGPSPMATSRSTIRVEASPAAFDVLRCFDPPGDDELVTFDVRVADAFAVVGSRSGLLHDVVTGPSGCEPRSPADPFRVGRAFLDVPFDNSRVAFTLTGITPVVDTVITLQVGGAPPGLGVDLGSTGGATRALVLPTEVVWSPTDRTLYAIDEVRRGLAIIRMRPRGTSSSASYVARIESFVE